MTDLDLPEPPPRVSQQIAELALRDLTVDPAVQRRLDEERVERMANNFNPLGLGVITCSWREKENNLINVVDGQHRVALCRRVRWTQPLRALVYFGLTLPEEAALFRILNASEKPSHVDQFIVRVTEGDPVAIACMDILGRNGWKVISVHSNGSFAATAALERAYILNKTGAELAVVAPTLAWGKQRNALNGGIIQGITLLYNRYGEGMDRERLIRMLREYNSDPTVIVTEARSLQKLIGGTTRVAFAKTVLRIYNKGAKTRALPEWS